MTTARFRQALRLANRDRLDRREKPTAKGASSHQWRNLFGALVCVYTREDAGVDADEPWVASCETHHEHIGCDTKRLAVVTARNSWEWCSGCRAAHPSI